MYKKLITSVIILFFTFTINAQDLTKGNWFVEANTGTFATGNTSFYLASSGGDTSFSIGLDGGYFLSDNLALKGGLGYSDFNESFIYKVGAKYYFNSKLPVGIDFTGVSESLWLGLQGGYAFFISDKVSIEPTLRYNASITGEVGIFQAVVGFVIFI